MFLNRRRRCCTCSLRVAPGPLLSPRTFRPALNRNRRNPSNTKPTGSACIETKCRAHLSHLRQRRLYERLRFPRRGYPTPCWPRTLLARLEIIFELFSALVRGNRYRFRCQKRKRSRARPRKRRNQLPWQSDWYNQLACQVLPPSTCHLLIVFFDRTQLHRPRQPSFVNILRLIY